tara:strand:+ start:998 stop:1315 length:318 start_codon:yes stop_codon:yes gene_type:complete
MNKIVLKSPTDHDFKNLSGQVVNIIETNGDNSGITNEALKYISNIVDLAELDLEWATQITDQGLYHLHGLPTLKYIDLSFCSGLTNEGIKKLESSTIGLTVEKQI